MCVCVCECIQPLNVQLTLGVRGVKVTDIFHILGQPLVLIQHLLLERGELGRGCEEGALWSWWRVHCGCDDVWLPE